MGKTQRAVADLFSQSIAESAAVGPTIVLLDEVETLAADRTKLSLKANPVDVHRATDAVLVQLDMLAEQHPHLLFVATSNFPQAVDSAFLSRCDMVMEVPLPGKDACKQILVDCLKGLAKTFPIIGKLSVVSLSFRDEPQANQGTISRDWGILPNTVVRPDTITVPQWSRRDRSARRPSRGWWGAIAGVSPIRALVR